jgi:3-deoxy-D-manno-octulosonic-acid transferase
VAAGLCACRMHPEAKSRTRMSSSRLAYAAYDAAGILLGICTAPFLALLLTRHGRNLSERLGRMPSDGRGLHHPVWIHAASVGEVLAAAALIDEVRRHWPDRHILVSTTSLAGRETARARAGADAVTLLPLDIRPVVERVMRSVRPSGLVLVETEIWPALIRAAARQGVPCVMVSGRVSERAAARYAWVRWLTRPVLAQVNAFAMQTDGDAARIVALGAPPERVQVIGSLKYARGNGVNSAAQQAAAAHASAMVDGRPLLIAASTHSGEEQMAVDACVPLWREHPDLLLLVAPRRPERFDEVDQSLVRTGLLWERRSRLSGAVGRATQVLLLDTLGELPNLLPAARGVFVGGTIVPVGGHNVLEPALFGKPAAFGPFTANVAAAADALLEHSAAVRVHSVAELRTAWEALLRSPRLAEEMGARGRAVVAARSAVARRTFDVVRRCLGK